MRPEALLRYLMLPLRGAPLLLIAVLSVAEGVTAGLWFAVPLRALLAVWAWTYVCVLVDSTAHGLPPPTLSAEMVSAVHEPRPFALAVLLAGTGLLAWYCEQSGLHALALAIVALALALVPAQVAVLAVEGNLLRAAWPPALLRVATGLGRLYALLLILAAVAAGLLVLAAGHLPWTLWYALALLAMFSLASLLGGSLYERRDELGLEVFVSPERTAARDRREEARALDREVDQIYALVRARQLSAALLRLESALGPAPVDPERIRWLRDRAIPWEDVRIADRLTGELISRLLVLGRRGEALLVLEDWWRRGRHYRPHATRDLDLLESAAAEIGHDATRERVVAERASIAARGPPGTAPRG